MSEPNPTGLWAAISAIVAVVLAIVGGAAAHYRAIGRVGAAEAKIADLERRTRVTAQRVRNIEFIVVKLAAQAGVTARMTEDSVFEEDNK